ncbi:MAG: hypothetical protein ACRDJN_04010 [Chloroflexota bacterium]
MSFTEETTPIETVPIAETSLMQLAEDIRRTGRPKVITGEGTGDLVMLPLADYEDLRESLEIMAGLLRGEVDIAAGRLLSNEDAQRIFRATIQAAAQASAKSA